MTIPIEKKQKKDPLLLGVIIDVSNSMKKNWKNEDGHKIPRLEMVKRALNSQFKKARLASFKKSRSIDVFCLGMGFKRTMRWNSIEFSYDREKSNENDWDERTDTSVVCDLLALSEIIPTEYDFEQLERGIKKKWEKYTKNIVDQASTLDESVYEELELFIKNGIKETATKKLQTSIPYRVLKLLSKISLFDRYEILSNLKSSISSYIDSWVIRIADVAANSSTTYVSNILSESKKIFDQEKQIYEEFIEDQISDFVTTLVNNLIMFLTLGFPIKKILDYFDEEKVLNLATNIYDYLDEEIKKNIALAWTVHNSSLFISTKLVRGSLDSKKVQTLTEKCIHKYSWDILKDFVKNLVAQIFKSKFEQQAIEQIPDWIGLSSSREITRTIKQIVNIFPDSIDESFYSESFVFGSTPISTALKIASLRFLDQSRKKQKKILVIISDGDFDSSYPEITSMLLQSVGVTVICCCLTPKNIMSTFLQSKRSRWPKGAKIMFDMASTVNQNDSLIEEFKGIGYEIADGVKLFYQINQSELLEDLFNSILEFE